MKKYKAQDFIYGIHAVTNLLINDSGKIKNVIVQKNTNNNKLNKIIKLCKDKSIALLFKENNEFTNMLFKSHIDANVQGVIATVDFGNFLQSEQQLKDFIENLKKHKLILILDSIQDPHNMGAIIRTAECLDVDCVIVPKDNSSKISSTVFKTSSGAVCYLPIFEVVNLTRTIKYLKAQNIWIYGADGSTDMSLYSENYKDSNIAIVMGAEGTGIRKLIANECDFLIKIPMSGKTESLNVSCATAIILSEITRQQQG